MIGFFRRMLRKLLESRRRYRYKGGHFSQTDVGNFIACRLDEDESRLMRKHINSCKNCEVLVSKARAAVWRED